MNPLSNTIHVGSSLQKQNFSLSSVHIGFEPLNIFTNEAGEEITQNNIPVLESFCIQLYKTFFQPGSPHSAFQFIPSMQKLMHLGQDNVSERLDNPKSSFTLVHNDLLKVVLIRWPRGKSSSIHGHPAGGCVFKVLKGNLEESRYTTDTSQRLLSVSNYKEGSIAYIDDRIGYHSVRNPSNESALSIHAYTPGLKN